MDEEIPIPNRPLTVKEQAIAAKLSDAGLKSIDATILGNCSDWWKKVASVVLSTVNALENQYPDLPHVFYAQRLGQLVKEGRLESRGNLLYMRFSEVRLPKPSSSGSVME